MFSHHADKIKFQSFASFLFIEDPKAFMVIAVDLANKGQMLNKTTFMGKA